MSRLTRQTAALPEQERLPERILQFGDGNFLRGFADDFVDRMNREADFNSGVVIVPPASTGKTVGMITEGTEKGNFIFSRSLTATAYEGVKQPADPGTVNPGTPGDTGKPDAPKTGDTGNIIVWVLAASFTVAMIPVTVTLKRKSR